MGYLIAGVGAFLGLVAYLWRRSVKKQDVLIEELEEHLAREKKQLYKVLEQKNAYIRKLEEEVMANADPVAVLNELFNPGSSGGKAPSN